MLITPDIELIETSQLYYEDASVRWVFDTNSSVVRLDTSRKPHTNSEHWISESSDLFSFSENGDLACLELSVPGENHLATFRIDKTITGRIKLHKPVFNVLPTMLRLFDPLNRQLSCFMRAPTKKEALTRVNLGKDFTIILADDQYFGFELFNPLDYLVSQNDAPLDPDNRADRDEYRLFAALLEIMSDNTVEALDNDMASVANELKTKILPHIQSIKSASRKNTVQSSLEDFIDYYA